MSEFFLQAPCEAEAQCAALVKADKVYATATEDMDALTFGSNILLRRLTFSEARKMPVQEFHFDKVLEGLELTRDEVIEYINLYQSLYFMNLCFVFCSSLIFVSCWDVIIQTVSKELVPKEP